MLPILPGQPAKGERQPAATAQDYRNLTPAQRDKLLAALAKRQPPKAETPPGCVKTEVFLMLYNPKSFASCWAMLPDTATTAAGVVGAAAASFASIVLHLHAL